MTDHVLEAYRADFETRSKLLSEMMSKYAGHVVVGGDLDVY
jgi:hypothetical protein